MKKRKAIISILLSLTLIVGMMGISAYAAEDGGDSKYTEALATSDASVSLENKYGAELATVFATSQARLFCADSNGVRLVGKSETNLGDLCADAYRAACDADIGFVEAWEIQGEIPQGDVRYSDILRVLPEGNKISKFTVSGGDILDALEMSARLSPSNNEGFLQVSGITFDIQETVKSTVKVDANGKFTGVSKEYRVTNVMVGGKELDLMSDYTVAATEGFLTGETGYTMFGEASEKSNNIMLDSDALYGYISKNLNGKITADYQKQAGRIDYIKLARQSQIDAQIEAGVEERMKNYSRDMAALQEKVNTQSDIIAVKTLSIKASSKLIKSGTARKIKLSWILSQDVDGLKYQIYKSKKKNSGYSKIYTTSNQAFTNSSSLSKGNTYYYKVRGYKYISGKYYYTDWSNICYRTIS